MNVRYISVGSWNIEHFGETTDDNDENEYAIAQRIELADCDVLALQELYVTSAGEPQENRFLRMALDLVEEHTGNHWEYMIFPNRRAGDRSQFCGVAWNTARVSKTGEMNLGVSTSAHTAIGDGKLWDRLPYAVKFSAGEDKTDFVVVSLHMKSNVGDRREVTSERRRLRPWSRLLRI